MVPGYPGGGPRINDLKFILAVPMVEVAEVQKNKDVSRGVCARVFFKPYI